MRKKALIALAAVVLAFGLTACGGQGGTTSSGAGSSGQILIGNLQDLSGATSVWGKAITNGAQLYIDHVNAQGGINGKQLKLITYDTQNSVQEAINAYNRLVTLDKVSAVIGPPVSNIGIALASISEQSKVPIVGSYIDERSTIKPDGSAYTYMFMMQPSSSQQAEIMAGYAMDKKGWKKFAVLYNQANAYSVSLEKPFVQYVQSHGGQVPIVETYNSSSDKDFTTQLTAIKNAGVDAVYTPNYIQELVLIARQARALGLKIPMIAGLDADPPFATLAGPVADNAILPNNFVFNDPALKQVTDAYKAKYGDNPLNKAFIGYDSALLIAKAVTAAGSTDPAKVAAALANLKDVNGTTGNISISAKTHQPYGLSMAMYQIQNGNYVFKQRYLTKELQEQ